MQHRLTCKDSSQGRLWYPEWEINMIRLRIGLHGNHPALGPKVPHHLQRPSSTDQTSTVRPHKTDFKNSKILNVEWLDYPNEKTWFYKLQHFYNLMSDYILFSPSSLLLWHILFTISVHILWSSQKSLGTVPLFKLHFIYFSALILKIAVQICFMMTSAWMQGWHKRMVKSWKRSLKVIAIPGGF